MQTILAKAAKIKLLICDVDGVFTDGQIYMSEKGEELKVFHVLDGLGIKLIIASGIQVAIISGRTSTLVQHRMEQLGIKYIFQGQENKLPIFQDLLTKLSLSSEQVCVIGDDLPDLPLLRRAGLGFAVNNAVPIVKQHADLQTQAFGGRGAVREVCDLILTAQNNMQTIVEQHL